MTHPPSPEAFTVRSFVALEAMSLLTAVIVIVVYNFIFWLMNLKFIKMSESESTITYVAYRVTRKGDGILLYKPPNGLPLYHEILDLRCRNRDKIGNLHPFQQARVKFHFSYRWGLISHLDIVLEDIQPV